MSINTYLDELSSKLVIKDDEKAKITTSVTSIKSKLNGYFGSEIIDIVVFGSYTRGTILPRKADEESDIDIMVVFEYNSNQYKPQTYLNWLKQFANEYYSRSEIHQDSPTIVLELNHIKFELVPAYIPFSYSNGVYNIPNGPTEWIITKPNDFNDTLIKCNTFNNSMIKPIIRLIKRWNVTNNGRNMKSFVIEKKIAENMYFARYSCSNFTDYLKEAFTQIRDYLNYDEIAEAIDTINQAIQDENDGLRATALSEIQEVFKDI
ncbi:SMODS domain-containing nucleotidyltransferase [Ruminococcus flavefaciens]|uniref:SMODS domain-containing nucleotidyltransferase n=1 Tax=Ruminococcus flavefaciens TaxID=1265 RepID=UPI002A908CB0|nr:nucleotidyltransferase domain-containing protein [Ruminococcus flavefaciens]MDY5692963.1 nucleotidyltransferase domain-containing protein [Ruminococcus flavefaciens]